MKDVANSIAERIDSALPALYLAFALPLILFLVFAYPPFQSPDEPQHFLRSVQAAGGEPVGIRFDAEHSGGHVERAAVDVAEGFDHLRRRGGGVVTTAALSQARAARWGGERVEGSFSGSSVYPPVAYAPVIGGVLLGKAFDLSVLDTFYLGRLLNALVATLVAAVALTLCRRGRYLMFALLLLPMTLSLFASVSHDALLIAVAALAVALLSRCFETVDAMRLGESMLLVAILVLLGTGKPAYAPLVGLFLLSIAVAPRADGGGNAPARWAYIGVASALIVGWVLFAMATISVPLQPGIASPKEQILFLVSNPIEILRVAVYTYIEMDAFYVRTFIGVLGWLDLRYPELFYTLATITLLAAFVADFLGGTRIGRRDQGLILGAVGLSVLAVFASMYLAWSPVGHIFVEGVQGRYFIPLFFFVGLLGPVLGAHPVPAAILRSVVVFFPVLTLVLTPMMILHRWYIPA